MLWDEFHHQSEVSRSILKISGNTSVGFLMRRFQWERIIKEYTEAFFTKNTEWLFERSYHYRQIFGHYTWELSELVKFLESFHTLKTCGVLHERESSINTQDNNPIICQTKFGNPWCPHLEENGLLYAMVAGNQILRGFQKKYIDYMELWVLIWKLRELDVEVGRRSSYISIVQRVQAPDTTRTFAIGEQKKFWSEMQKHISTLITGLQGLIDSEATLPNASQPQGKPLPQVDLARIL